MKIYKVNIKDFKSIKDLSINLEGKNILLLGDNDVGKSTFIQALKVCLGEKAPNIPYGEIEVEVKGENNFKFHTEVHKGKTSIIVTDDKGFSQTSKSIIGAITGAIDFNIDDFVKLSESKAGKKEQLKIIEGFLSQDVLKSLNDIKLDIDYNYEERTDINREIKTYQGIIKEAGITGDDLKTYSLPIETKDLQIELTKVIETNEKIVSVKERIMDRQKSFSDNMNEIDNSQTKIKLLEDGATDLFEKNKQADVWLKENKEIDIKKLQNALTKAIETNEKIIFVKEKIIERNEHMGDNKIEIDDSQTKIKLLGSGCDDLELKTKQANKWLSENKEVDKSEIEVKLNKATEHNLKYQTVQDVSDKIDKLEDLKKQEQTCTGKIDENRQLLADTIRDCELPVPELSFNEDSLLYKGYEVDKSILSTSEIMSLGVQLKMAQSANVKALCLENGQSLGTVKLEMIKELCKDKGYQLILEQVERGTKELKIEIIPE